MQLSQKETTLLKDLKEQEKLCADKYQKNAADASDAQLKQLFNQLAQNEQQHWDTLSQIEKGTVPPMSGSSGSSSSSSSGSSSSGSSNSSSSSSSGSSSSGSSSGQQSFQATYKMGETPEKKNDCYLCSDVLAAEKHTSHLYDTCVFEFKDQKLRDSLNHIQKEEQEHGKMIYDYMQTNGMYS